jgi:hypothetical protein
MSYVRVRNRAMRGIREFDLTDAETARLGGRLLARRAVGAKGAELVREAL